MGLESPYGQRISQSSHDLDVCWSQGMHCKDKRKHLSPWEGSCSQSLVILALSETRNTTCMCLGHGGLSLYGARLGEVRWKHSSHKRPNKRSWTYGKGAMLRVGEKGR